MFILKFGKYKGQQVMDVPPEYLTWLVENTDPRDAKNNGKFAKQNKELLEACQTALQMLGPQRTAPKITQTTAAQLPQKSPVVTNELIKEFEDYIKIMYDTAIKMQSAVDVYKETRSKNSEHLPF